MTPPEIHQAAANRINHQARRVEEMRQLAALTPGWFGRGVLHGANLAFITHSEIGTDEMLHRMADPMREILPVLSPAYMLELMQRNGLGSKVTADGYRRPVLRTSTVSRM